MKVKSKKVADLKQLEQDISASPTMFICTFEGLKVEQDFELRKQVRAAGARYRVVQNRMARLAAKGTPYEPALGGLRGMTSIAFGGDDPVSLIKALVAYGKDHAVFQFKAGVVEGRVLDLNGLNELAKLPGRLELQAKVLFLIQSPAQRLVSVLNGVGRNLAVVINQAVEQEKFAAQ
ncbi:MAG TPA: 50S ribosomal protein L10 [Bryobacterales bacterium]|nr:50S ribosomal protein L10 [Bryobacterales bacterium]